MDGPWRYCSSERSQSHKTTYCLIAFLSQKWKGGVTDKGWVSFSQQNCSAGMSQSSQARMALSLIGTVSTVSHGDDAPEEGSTFKVPVVLHKPRWRVLVVWFAEAEGGRRVGVCQNCFCRYAYSSSPGRGFGGRHCVGFIQLFLGRANKAVKRKISFCPPYYLKNPQIHFP